MPEYHAVHLRRAHVEQLIAHAEADAPHEACGFILGDAAGNAQELLPLPNAADSPCTQFLVPPDALLAAYQYIEASQWQLISVYHSHPASPPIPSPDDIRAAEHNLPQVAHLIISLQTHHPRLKAWHIQPDDIHPLPLHIGDVPLTPDTATEPPLTHAQKYAIIIAMGVALVILWWVAFTLLPPAPVIPAPIS